MKNKQNLIFLLLILLNIYFSSYGQQYSASLLALSDSTIQTEIASFSITGKQPLNEYLVTKSHLKEIPLKKVSTNYLYFDDGNLVSTNNLISISIQPLNLDSHIVSYSDSSKSSIYLIENKPFWGKSIPSSYIEEIRYIHVKYQLKLPKIAFADLFDPIVDKATCKAFQSKKTNNRYIYMTGYHRQKQYEVTWVISDGKYVGRVLDEIY
jgi:hypothetical protein